MLKIRHLNDEFEVEEGVNGFQLIKKIILDNEIAKRVIAITVDGIIKDLSTTITENSTITFILNNSETGLDIIRHSTAHLLAYAVQELYGNKVQFAIGPSIDNGFYYDFDIDTPFSESDLETITSKMNELIKKDERFVREVWTREEALKFFKEKNQNYKVELINDLDQNEKIGIYKIGNFTDLCRGSHVPSARYLKNFKLTKVAGAYWKGNSNNKMLQRIYGIAFESTERLTEYLNFIEEAEKRDHRKICKAMDLLHFEPEYAPGAPFYHQKGLYIYNKLVSYMREKQDNADYIEISTPRVMDRILWETSGHWEKYGEHNYSGQTEDGKQFCIKPMNCPGSVLVYTRLKIL